MNRKRRDFLRDAAIVSAAGLTAGCSQSGNSQNEGSAGTDCAPADKLTWKMVTTWPRDYPGVGTGANRLAEMITRMSGGRLEVKIYGAGELVPAFEVFDAVSNGTAELGHGAAYYWKGKSAAAQFFGSVPFGMTAAETNSWLYYGDGLALWEQVYTPFGVRPLPAGNTGVQMGGWYNQPIESVADLQGLKIRIPGLGCEVMRKAGATVQNIPGGELFTALSTGTIDATEWVGPWNDLAFGLHQAADYYYYPGWHEPGSVLECLINQRAWSELPDDLQAIVRNACQAVNLDMASEFTARNQAALDTLVNEHGVELRAFPEPVLDALKGYSREVLEEVAAQSELAARVHDSYTDFMRSARKWTARSEQIYLNSR